MELIDRNERTLRRLRDLQPIPPWLVRVLSVVGQPVFWLSVLCVAMWRATQFQMWNMLVIFIIVGPIIGMLYYLAGRLMRDIQPDIRELPHQVTNDPELRRAVDRLTRQGGVVRLCQREVIDAYVRTHYTDA